MAIYNGPMASKMRGKVGEIVAAKTVGGQTALRAYQPNVKNPNTRRQQSARLLFKTVSAAAAALGEAIQIGYVTACKGLKMYPRNLFVGTYAKYGNGVFTESGGEVIIDVPSIKMSRKAGLDVVPVSASYTPAAGGQPATITVASTGNVQLGDGERLGVVVVFADDYMQNVCVVKGLADTAIDVPVADPGRNVFAFFKVIEPTGTSVAADKWPWKYPSATGDCVLVTTVS